VKIRTLALLGAVLSSAALFADTLGFFGQKFNAINFEKGKWDRFAQFPCKTYTASADGAMVDVMRFGTSNLVPFRAAKGLKVMVCGSTAAFDEGFEAIRPKTP
jgi:hypothetical protein